MVHIIAVKYTGTSSDFEIMMNEHMYENALFIFNDNFVEHTTFKKGSGNAKMRKYNNYSQFSRPRSFGIPTGHYRNGYTSLEECQHDLLTIFNELDNILSLYQYDTIVYSIDSLGNPILGTAIFRVDIEVLKFITKHILSLGSHFTFFDGEVYSKTIQLTSSMIDSL